MKECNISGMWRIPSAGVFVSKNSQWRVHDHEWHRCTVKIYTSRATPGWFPETRGLLFIQSCILQVRGTQIPQDKYCLSMSHTRLSGFDLKVQLIPLWGALICDISSFLLQAIWYVSLSINHTFSKFTLVQKKEKTALASLFPWGTKCIIQ